MGTRAYSKNTLFDVLKITAFYHQAMKSSALVIPILSLLAASVQATPLKDVTSNYQPRPYTVNVDQSLIELARQKAITFRSTVDPTPAWFDGPPATDIEPFAKYWAEEYDWPAIQASINTNFSHFYTTVPPPGGAYNEPVDLHFIHQRSARSDAIPILFLHGWPSTALEWAAVIPDLASPGNASEPAFHVVAPDIPGYGFSPALNGSRVGVSGTEYASMFASLMQQLGYDKYIVYATDLGIMISQALKVDYIEHIIHYVTDFYIVQPSDEDQARYIANQTSAEENKYIGAINTFFTSHSAYSAIHSTYPAALAFAMNDSPVGFLAWIYHLSASVTDRPYGKAELITNTLLLWIQGVYSNIRSYKELFSPAAFSPEPDFRVPTSVLQFGGMPVYPELDGFNYVVSFDCYTLMMSTNNKIAPGLG
jgi:pimeloyl-ACP methyl ester carboxylesterase